MGCRPLCVGCLLVSLPTGTRQGSRRHQAGRRGRPPPSKKRRGSHRHQAGRRGSSGRALCLSPVRSKLPRRRPSTPSKSSPPSRETPLPLSWTSSSADSRREAAPREVGGLVLQAAGAGGHGGDLAGHLHGGALRDDELLADRASTGPIRRAAVEIREGGVQARPASTLTSSPPCPFPPQSLSFSCARLGGCS
jgi:hypothetical protein